MILGVLLVVALACVGILVQAEPVVGVTEARHACLAVYLDDKLQPTAVFRVEHAYKDYQTRGFFRIGALPLLVLDGLSMEVRDAERMFEALNQAIAKWTSKNARRSAIEARDFSLCFCPGKRECLRARRARLESPKEWRLEQGSVTLPGATATVAFSQAILTVSGPDTGELTCETPQGSARLRLFSLPAHQNP